MSKPKRVKDIFKIGGYVLLLGLAVFILKLYTTDADEWREDNREKIICDAVVNKSNVSDDMGEIKKLVVTFEHGKLEVDCDPTENE
jgi:hypothetical protein